MGGASFETLDFSLPSYSEGTKGDASAAKDDGPPSFAPSFPELKLPGSDSTAAEEKSTPAASDTSEADKEAAKKAAEEEKAVAKKTAEEEKAAAKKAAEEEKAAKKKVRSHQIKVFCKAGFDFSFTCIFYDKGC